MNTMHARPRQRDGRTERETDEHHGNSAMIRSMKIQILWAKTPTVSQSVQCTSLLADFTVVLIDLLL